MRDRPPDRRRLGPCASRASSRDRESRRRAHREPGLETGEIGQLSHERAVDDHQPPKAAVRRSMSPASCGARLRGGVGRCRQAAWHPRISRRRSVYFQASTRRVRQTRHGETIRTRRRATAATVAAAGQAPAARRVRHRPEPSSACVLTGRIPSVHGRHAASLWYCAYPVASSSSARSFPPSGRSCRPQSTWTTSGTMWSKRR